MYDIRNKVVLVTGVAAGIGQSTVRAFLEEEAKHVAILDLNENTGTVLENQLTAKYGLDKVKFYKCDVTTNELVETYEKILDHQGYIDVVVNCAGILDDLAYEKCIEINLMALVKSSYKAYEIMRKDKGGRGGTIVNISSIAAIGLGTCSVPVYNATKSAVLRFSTSLGAEPNYVITGVRVFTVCFGVTDTTILSSPNAFDEIAKKSLDDIVAGAKLQTPKNAARGLIQALKYGASASTWLVSDNLPAEDITSDVSEAYEVMGRSMPDFEKQYNK